MPAVPVGVLPCPSIDPGHARTLAQSANSDETIHELLRHVDILETAVSKASAMLCFMGKEIWELQSKLQAENGDCWFGSHEAGGFGLIATDAAKELQSAHDVILKLACSLHQQSNERKGVVS